MFAGRYLWWMLMSIAGFLFFAVYFDYVTWLVIQLSACQSVAGACGRIHQVMGGSLKPAGFLIAGAVVVTCTAARVVNLRMSPLWSLAFIVWFMASAPFVLIFRKLWSGQLSLAVIADSMPPAFLFLAATIAFLILPLEDSYLRWFGWRRRMHLTAIAAAAYGAAFTLATQEHLRVVVEKWTGMFGLAETLAALQMPLFDILTLGTKVGWTGFAAAAVFMATLSLQVLPAMPSLRAPAPEEGR